MLCNGRARCLVERAAPLVERVRACGPDSVVANTVIFRFGDREGPPARARRWRPVMAYRHYVLFLLLLVYVHSMFARMLPAFLVAVPTIGCETVCAGTSEAPLCHQVFTARSGNVSNTAGFVGCQECRARIGRYAGGGETGNWLNMRDGACIQPWQYGFLMGYGFALPFVLGSVPVARMADSANRRTALALSLGAWSVATWAMSWTDHFWPLFASRCVLGLSQAMVVPMSMSLVMQHFDEASHGSAGSILSSGVCLGAGAASFAIPLAIRVGWRASCAVVGGVGLVLAALTLATVHEPERERAISKRKTRRRMGRSPVVWILTLATMFRLAGSYTLAAFLPVYYLRAQLPGYSPGSYGLGNAAIVAVAGLLSALIGGTLSDCLRDDFASAPSLVAAGAQAIAAVCYVGVFRSTTFAGSLACYGLALLTGECWYGLTLVQIKGVVPSETQGRAISIVLAVATIASNFSPSAVGALDPGTAELGSLILAAVTSCILLAGLALAVAAYYIERGGRLEVIFESSSSEELPRRSESVVELLSANLARRASASTLFSAPGLADIVVPDTVLEDAPSACPRRGRSMLVLPLAGDSLTLPRRGNSTGLLR